MNRLRPTLVTGVLTCFVIVGAHESFRLSAVAFSAPFHSPDSMAYLQAAKRAWHWQDFLSELDNPISTGFSFLLSIAFLAGLDELTTLEVLWVASAVILFLVPARAAGKAWACLGVVLFLVDPTWIMLRLTL